MNDSVARFAPYVFALLRIVVGLMYAQHGSQKLFSMPDGGHPAPELFSLMGLAGVLELACGLLVAVGLFTRPAAFLASGTMAVAYFMAHAPNGPLAIQNQGETAVLYCFIFFYIWAHGAGSWSLDGMQRHNTAIPAV